MKPVARSRRRQPGLVGLGAAFPAWDLLGLVLLVWVACQELEGRPGACPARR